MSQQLTIKLSLFAVAIATLSACSEDTNNDALVAETRAQNDLLAQQIEQQANAEPIVVEVPQARVSVTGFVSDIENPNQTLASTIEIYLGNEKITEASSTDGSFTLQDLMPSSNYHFVVTANDTEFSPRLFSVDTRSTNSADISMNIGNLPLAKTVDYAFSLTNFNTGEAINGLTFTANSAIDHTGRGEWRYNPVTGRQEYVYPPVMADSNLVSNFEHTSQYNSATNQYEISLPAALGVLISADIDADNNGEPDFEIAANSEGYIQDTTLQQFASANDGLSNIQLIENPSNSEPETLELQINLSLLDENKEQLENANVQGEFVDANNDIEWTTASLNADTKQYQLTVHAEYNRNQYIYIDPIVESERRFASSRITVGAIEENEFGEKSVEISSDYSSRYRYIVEDGGTIDYVTELSLSNNNSTARLFVFEPNEATSELLVYFSEPVTLEQNDLTLEGHTPQLTTITRGNDSASDDVPEGTTVVEFSPSNIHEIDIATDLNGTRLIATPRSPLTEGERYTYSLHDFVTDSSDVRYTDIYNPNRTIRSQQFVPEASNPSFNPELLIADNRNYTTNGSNIVNSNTAGEDETANNNHDSVYIYLARTAANVYELTLTVSAYVENGVLYIPSYPNQSRVIIDGSVNASTLPAIRVASNERVIASENTIRGTTLEEGQRFHNFRAGAYLSDFVTGSPSEENTVTVEYEYRLTKDSDLITGEITLPVR